MLQLSKFLHHFSGKYQVPFTWNYFATGHGKGVVDGIGREAKSIACPRILSKMISVIVTNALDFTEVCKANLHRVNTHLMAKEQQQEAENLDLLSVFPKVKGISKAHVAVMNADRVLRI